MTSQFESHLTNELTRAAGDGGDSGSAGEFAALELRAEKARQRQRSRYRLVGACVVIAVLVGAAIFARLAGSPTAQQQVSSGEPPAAAGAGASSTTPTSDPPIEDIDGRRTGRSDSFAQQVRGMLSAEPALGLTSDSVVTSSVERSINGGTSLAVTLTNQTGEAVTVIYGEPGGRSDATSALPNSKAIEPSLLPAGVAGSAKERENQSAVFLQRASPSAYVSITILGAMPPAPVDVLTQQALAILSSHPLGKS